MNQGMNSEIEITYQMLQQAEFPEDVFGALTATDADGKRGQLLAIYRQMAKVLHPDRHQPNTPGHEIAQAAFPLLGELFERAKLRIEQEIYGTRQLEEQEEEIDFIIKTRQREYHLRATLAEGDLSIVYGGDFIDAQNQTVSVVAKVIKDPADNDLALNEARVLKLLESNTSKITKHLPKYYDQFRTTEGQLGLIISRLDNCFDLYSVREKYRDGVPERHMVWMLRRLLSVTGYAHKHAVIHGNIEPAHIMIRPKDHNLFLIDWSYAAVNPFHTGDGFKVLNEEFSAPEVAERKKPVPASDLYSIGKCMIYLLGGDIKTNTVPNNVSDKIKRLLQFFVMKSPLQRAQDAWEMHDYLGKLAIELWGPRKFIEFEM